MFNEFCEVASVATETIAIGATLRNGARNDLERGRPIMGKWRAFAVVVLMSSAGVVPAPAAQTVRVLGCVRQGVEMGCLIIEDRKTGRTYQINAASPKPDPAQNLAVTLQGEITPGVDFCQQGQILTAITWRYTKTRCAPGE